MSNKFYKNRFILMGIALSIALIGVLVGFGLPSISKHKEQANLRLIQYDSDTVKTLVASENMVEQLEAGGKATKVNNLKDFDSKDNYVVYKNGVSENTENRSFKKDLKEGELYILDSKYMKEETGIHLQRDFYTNIGGDVYYLSESDDVKVAKGDNPKNASSVRSDIDNCKEELSDKDTDDQVGVLKDELSSLEKELNKIKDTNKTTIEEVASLRNQITKIKNETNSYSSKMATERSNHYKSMTDIINEINKIKEEILLLEDSNNQNTDKINSLNTNITELSDLKKI